MFIKIMTASEILLADNVPIQMGIHEFKNMILLNTVWQFMIVNVTYKINCNFFFFFWRSKRH